MNALLDTKRTLKAHLWSTLWIMTGLVLLVPIASAMTWSAIIVDSWPANSTMLIGSMLAMAVADIGMRRIARLPLLRIWSAALSLVLLSFLILAATLLLTRSYYSRSYLLIAATFSVVWVVAGHWIKVWRAQRMVWGIVEIGCVEPLRTLDGIRWTSLCNPSAETASLGVVVVDMTALLSPDWARFLTNCRFRNIPILNACRVYEALTGRVHPEWVHEGDLVGVRIARSMSLLKRTFDWCICLAFAPVLLLLTGLCAVAIKLDSRGPVFYQQDRVGLDNQTFRVFKLRTMVMEGEGDVASFADEWDGRITRVGHILRKSRLDEIPQFWNVIRGEMSIVGPRPEQRVFVDQFEESIPFYALRHLVRPGITGWAQVHYGYAADEIENRRKLEFDLFYLKRWSFMLDTMILMRTIVVVLTARGAR